MTDKDLKIYDLVVDENDESTLSSISLVNAGAIDVDFVYFNSENEYKFSIDEKGEVVGPILIPNQLIYRNKPEPAHYVRIDKENIEKSVQLFFKNSRQISFNINHSEQEVDAYVYESWIVEDPENDKAINYGFNVPSGTSMIKAKIEDEDVKEMIKNGEINGFSIEGRFNRIQANLGKYDSIDTTITDKIARNAEQGLDWLQKAKESGRSNIPSTRVGKIRANQLKNKKSISFGSIQRIYNYLNKLNVDYKVEADGIPSNDYINYMMWGGDEALKWSENIVDKMNEIDAKGTSERLEKIEKNNNKIMSLIDNFLQKFAGVEETKTEKTEEKMEAVFKLPGGEEVRVPEEAMSESGVSIMDEEENEVGKLKVIMNDKPKGEPGETKEPVESVESVAASIQEKIDEKFSSQDERLNTVEENINLIAGAIKEMKELDGKAEKAPVAEKQETELSAKTDGFNLESVVSDVIKKNNNV